VAVVVVAGAGMLTGGVAGSVFASPPTSSILEAIRALATHNPGKLTLKSSTIFDENKLIYFSYY
jgi:dihydroxyacetone kinase